MIRNSSLLLCVIQFSLIALALDEKATQALHCKPYTTSPTLQTLHYKLYTNVHKRITASKKETLWKAFIMEQIPATTTQLLFSLNAITIDVNSYPQWLTNQKYN
jgi:hypothetical protein